MCGRFTDSSSGQLALMDALVFFMVAMVISTLLLHGAESANGSMSSGQKGTGQADAGAILQVFLHASIGEEITLFVGEEVRIQRSSEIGECLYIELCALTSGVESSEFDHLNHAFLETLDAVCSPVFEPYLLAFITTENEPEAILALPIEPPECDTRYAGSAEFPSPEGSIFLVVLVLVPASFPEAA